MIRRLRTSASCITRQRLVASEYRRLEHPGTVFFAPANTFARLRTERGNPGLLLQVQSGYRIVRDEAQPRFYQTTAVSYLYRILDLHEREILAFHWHPEGVSPVRHPHLHLTSRVRPIEIDDPANPNRERGHIALAEMHISTGPVPFEDVVRLLIEEFRVIPLRPDWEEILNQI